MSDEAVAQETILVTGASSAIGCAIATRLSADGYAIAAHYGKNRKAAEATRDRIMAQAGACRLLNFDVGNAEETRSVLEQDIEAHGAYYGAVCNAGVTRDAAFPMLELEDWRTVIDVNLNSFYNVLHPIVMPMIRRRKPGRIVTISSVSGIMGNRGQTNYSASKAGLIGATKSLAVELAKRKITVNCVAPGLIESEMTNELPLEKMLEAVPMQRLGRPEEVASVVAFLCSEDAAYVTRQVISPNGGMF